MGSPKPYPRGGVLNLNRLRIMDSCHPELVSGSKFCLANIGMLVSASHWHSGNMEAD